MGRYWWYTPRHRNGDSIAMMGSAFAKVDRFLRGQWVDETPCRPAARGEEFTGAWLHTPVARQALAAGHQEGQGGCP